MASEQFLKTQKILALALFFIVCLSTTFFFIVSSTGIFYEWVSSRGCLSYTHPEWGVMTGPGYPIPEDLIPVGGVCLKYYYPSLGDFLVAKTTNLKFNLLIGVSILIIGSITIGLYRIIRKRRAIKVFFYIWRKEHDHLQC